MTVRRPVRITNPLGMHARAAARFSRVASQFAAHVIVERDWHGTYGSCIMCGYVHEVLTSPPVDLAAEEAALPAATPGPAEPGRTVERRSPPSPLSEADAAGPMHVAQAPEVSRLGPSLADTPRPAKETAISASPAVGPAADEPVARQSPGPPVASQGSAPAREDRTPGAEAGAERSSQSTPPGAAPALRSTGPAGHAQLSMALADVINSARAISSPAHKAPDAGRMARAVASPPPRPPEATVQRLPVSEVLFGPSLASRLRPAPFSSPVALSRSAAMTTDSTPASGSPADAAPHAASAARPPRVKPPVTVQTRAQAAPVPAEWPAAGGLAGAPRAKSLSVARSRPEPAVASPGRGAQSRQAAGQEGQRSLASPPPAGEQRSLPVAPSREDGAFAREPIVSLSDGAATTVQLAGDVSADRMAIAGDEAGSTQEGGVAQGRGGAPAAAAVDLDALARQVYDILRRRLRVEQERAYGRCG